MFLVVYSKCQEIGADHISRAERLFREHVREITFPSDVNKVVSQNKVVLYYSGSDRIHKFGNLDHGSWYLILGNPFFMDGTQISKLFQDYLNKPKETDILSRMKGNFILTLFDAPNNTLYVLPDLDCIGICFYVESKDFVAVSNSAMLLARLARTSIDPIASSALFYVGYLPGGRSIYQGVNFLRNFTTAEISDNGIHINQVFSPFSFATPIGNKFIDIAENVYDIYIDRFKKTKVLYEREPTPSLGLTGGLDSRIVAALGKEVGLHLRCFFDYTTQEETELSTWIAQVLGLEHTVLPRKLISPDQFMETLLLRSRAYDAEVPGPFGFYDSAQYATQTGGTIFFGFGSEGILKPQWEIVGRQTWNASNVEIAGILARQFGQSVNYNPNIFHSIDIAIDGLDYIVQSYLEDVTELPHLNPLIISNYLYCRNRMTRFVGRFINGCQEVAPSDSPLADFEVMSIVFQSPGNIYNFNNLVKYLAVRAAPELAKIPTDRGLSGAPLLKVHERFFAKGANFMDRSLRFLNRKFGKNIDHVDKKKYRNWLTTMDRSPVVAWGDLLKTPLGKNYLPPETLNTAFMYNMDEYRKMIDDSLEKPFSAHDNLAIAIQLEIAARYISAE